MTGLEAALRLTRPLCVWAAVASPRGLPARTSHLSGKAFLARAFYLRVCDPAADARHAGRAGPADGATKDVLAAMWARRNMNGSEDGPEWPDGGHQPSREGRERDREPRAAQSVSLHLGPSCEAPRNRCPSRARKP